MGWEYDEAPEVGIISTDHFPRVSRQLLPWDENMMRRLKPRESAPDHFPRVSFQLLSSDGNIIMRLGDRLKSVPQMKSSLIAPGNEVAGPGG